MTTIQNALDEIGQLFVQMRDADWNWSYHCRKEDEAIAARADWDINYHGKRRMEYVCLQEDIRRALKEHGVDLLQAELNLRKKEQAERESA